MITHVGGKLHAGNILPVNVGWQVEYSPRLMDRRSFDADARRMNELTVIPRLKDRRPRHFIRQWRKYRHLTIDQLADRIGTSQPNLSKIERGLVPYTQPMLEALADALQCSPADLLVRDPTDADAIWTVWEQLAPEQRRQVIAIAQTLRRLA